MASNIHTYTLVGFKHAYIHARGIQTYIHTYSLFARRINIDFNSCAAYRIEISKRGYTLEALERACMLEVRKHVVCV